VQLRAFRYPEDYPAVIELWNNAGPGIHVRRSDERQEILKKLERDPDLFLIAEADGRIIGSVLGGFDGRSGLVYHLAVAPEYRKQGIGSALMDELEQRLQQKGCIRTYLMVTFENMEAVRFYEKRGWELMTLYTYAKNLD